MQEGAARREQLRTKFLQLSMVHRMKNVMSKKKGAKQSGNTSVEVKKNEKQTGEGPRARVKQTARRGTQEPSSQTAREGIHVPKRRNHLGEEEYQEEEEDFINILDCCVVWFVLPDIDTDSGLTPLKSSLISSRWCSKKKERPWRGCCEMRSLSAWFMAAACGRHMCSRHHACLSQNRKSAPHFSPLPFSHTSTSQSDETAWS